jgi:hypothetical protein
LPQHSTDQVFRTAQWYAGHLAATVNTSTVGVGDATVRTVIMLSSDPLLLAEYGFNLPTPTPTPTAATGRVQLAVLTMQDYLYRYHPNLTTARVLLESLDLALEMEAEAALAAAAAAAASSCSIDRSSPASAGTALAGVAVDKWTGYAHYLPKSTAQAGIKAGMYLRGVLRVSKHNSMSEAYVTFGDVLIQRKISNDDVLVAGEPKG